MLQKHDHRQNDHEPFDWWAGLSQIYETRTLFVLERGISGPVIVPNRARRNTQLAEFRNLAASAPYCKVKLEARKG
jgi:hypothetical protein